MPEGESKQRSQEEEPQGGRTLYGQGGAAMGTLGCGRSDTGGQGWSLGWQRVRP